MLLGCRTVRRVSTDLTEGSQNANGVNRLGFENRNLASSWAIIGRHTASKGRRVELFLSSAIRANTQPRG